MKSRWDGIIVTFIDMRRLEKTVLDWTKGKLLLETSNKR